MATFACPRCAAGELRIVAALELPADRMSDEITVQVAACGSCGLRVAAVYEESRRGNLDSDCWVHAGYRNSADGAGELLALIRSCPRPLNARCACPAHAALGTTDETGRWNGLARRASVTAFRWPRRVDPGHTLSSTCDWTGSR